MSRIYNTTSPLSFRKHTLMLFIFFGYLCMCLPNTTNSSKSTTIQAFSIPLLYALQSDANTEADSLFSLIQQIKYIRNIPHVIQTPGDSGEIVTTTICGDSLFWIIAQKGKEAIPWLIFMTQNADKTNIQIPCSNDSLSVGAIAFIILDKIMPIPYFSVYKIQWDVLTLNCAFGYPEELLEFVSSEPNHAYLGLLNWYYERSDEIISIPINPDARTECQLKYQIINTYMLPPR